MSVHRDRERDIRLDKKLKARDVSLPKKSAQESIKTRKPVVTNHDKPAKPKTSTATIKDSHKPSVKLKLQVGDGKPAVKSVPVTKPAAKKSSKTDLIYLKDVIEKNAMRHREDRKEAEEIKVREVKKPEEDQFQVNAEKEDDRIKMKRDRTRTRTLSPTEIKQLLPSKMAAGDVGRREETNGYSEPTEMDEQEDGYDEYENDFEDYESDFEDDESQSTNKSKRENETYTEEQSSEEEEASQIENYPTEIRPETPPTRPTSSAAWKQTIEKRQLDEIRHYINKENQETTERRKSLTSSTVDLPSKPQEEEGFANDHFVDFSLASKKQKRQKEATAAKKRGRELLNMITLDTITYNILEIPPIPYDTFMATFGKSNTKQVYVQTNEDVLEEETQTDDILTSNKWTQYPADYLGRKRRENNENYVLTKEERLGVGEDNVEQNGDEEDYSREVVIPSTTNNLLNFLSWSSQVVLETLERKSGNFLNLENMPNRTKDLAFADGYARLNTQDVLPLANKAVTQLCLLNEADKKLLTVHLQSKKRFQRCLLCVWSFRELSKPLKILVACNRVTSCIFGPNQGNVVLAGLADGSICMWDLREPSIYHNQVSEDSKWILQSPTYTTAGDIKENHHSASIVSVRLLNTTESSDTYDDFAPLQVCSLDESGTIVVWSVIQLDKTLRTEPSDDLGLAHWGRLKLVKSSTFSVFESLREEMPDLCITCNDLVVNAAEDDGFYIANSFGSVHHVSVYGSAMKPKFFVPSKQDALVAAMCLEICPFDSNYFLVGCGDGSIRLHCRHQERPLITLYSNIIEGERQISVTAICWLNTRPCVIISLDSKSRIHLWDLAVSDMYPDMTLLLTEKKIHSMKLLTDSNGRQVPFLVLGTEDGSVEIHRIKKEYGRRTAAEIDNEKKMFLKYVKIL